MAVWKSNRPEGHEQLQDLGNLMRSNRSALDDGLQQHFHWSDDTANAGSLKTASGNSFDGTVRFHYGPESTRSYPAKGDGSGFLTSDTSEMGVFLGGQYVPTGGEGVITGLHFGYADTFNRHYGIVNNAKILTQIGAQTIFDAASRRVTFPTAYDTDDVKVFVQNSSQGAASSGSYHYAIHNSSSTGFSVSTLYIGPGGTDPDSAFIRWKSVGTVSL